MPMKAKTVEELLKEGKEILQDVDKAQLFDNLTPRNFPTFSQAEIKYGPVLGVGGFGVVREIAAFDEVQQGGQSTQQQPLHKSTSAVSFADHIPDNEEDYSNKGIMQKAAQRNGQARYAIKKMQPRNKFAKETDFIRGMIDLAIETKYLRSFHHPNIVKMRGYAEGDDWISDQHFIILDRLYGTLEDRIKAWKRKKPNGSKLKSLFRRKPAEKTDWTDQLTCAYDLSSALKYLHQHHIVYRDLKPENIGFDIRGDIKLFDFGLATSMCEHKKDPKGGFKLTARTGSFPYMAPEVAKCKSYDASCDVFSFAILLWEILSLNTAFALLTSRREFYEHIAILDKRPHISKKALKSWPVKSVHILKEAWDPNPSKRPSMERLAVLLRSDLEDFSHEDSIINRTLHLQDRSYRSIHRVAKLVRRSRTSSHDFDWEDLSDK